MVSVASKSNPPIRVPDPHHREKKTREIDAYVAEGKIPVEVDLSQHPERSVEARGCTFPILFTLVYVEFTLFTGLMGRVAASINDVKTAQEM